MIRRLQVIHARLSQAHIANTQRRNGFTLADLNDVAGDMPLAIGTGTKARAVWQRIVAGILVFTLWLGPVQLVWQNAWEAALQIAGTPVPHFVFGLPPAAAQVITDPSAPIRFQPTITQSTGAGGGVPVVNITAPNVNGISLNQYRQFNVDAIGLILNNSTTGGGAFLGGNVSANPNLTVPGAQSANLIVNQVTSQSNPSNINGTIEVFGQKAGIVIANPNGITCTGCGFINTSRITLSTGAPQFLDAVGGNATSFEHAAALAYDVQSGRIQIEGLAGSNGQPGSGIEGTVGAINLIGETVGVNATLYAGDQINIIAGRQLVSEAPTGQGKAGSDYAVTANGTNNAASSTSAIASANPALQIDATAFGAMTAGQIKIIGTTEGLGVRADGNLAATVNGLSIDANGDVRIGATYGKQGVDIRSAGSATLDGSGLGENGFTVQAAHDINVNGTLQSGKDLAINGGDSVTVTGATAALGDMSLSAASGAVNIGGQAASQGVLNITAANDITIGGQAVAGKTAAIRSQAGKISVAGTLMSQDTMTVNAAGDVTVGGSTQSGGDLHMTAGGNLSVGDALAVGNAVLTANSITTTGSVNVGSNLDMVATDGLTTQGQGMVQGDAKLQGSNAVTNGGTWIVGGDLDINGRNVVNQSGAQWLSLGTTTVNATDVANAGTLYGKALSINAGGSLNNSNGTLIGEDTLNVSTAALAANQNGLMYAGDTASPTSGNLTLTVTGGNGSFNNTGGQLLSGGNITLNLRNQSFDPTATSAGAMDLNGTLGINARAVNISGTWAIPGNALALNASEGITNTGTIAKSGSISIATQGSFTNSGTITSGADVNLSGSINNQTTGVIHAEQDVNLSGDIVNAGVVEALRDINITGSNYNNSGATTQANRDINVNISGVLANVGGIIAAGGNIGITAATVNNDRAGPVDLPNVQYKVVNNALLLSTVIGTKSVYAISAYCTDQACYNGYIDSPATIADLFPSLATNSVTAYEYQGVSDIDGQSNAFHYWMFYDSSIVVSGGINGHYTPKPPDATIALPTVDHLIRQQVNGKAGAITAGSDLAITANSLLNRGSSITAGGNGTLNVASLDNGLSDTLSSSVQESVNQNELNAFMAQLQTMAQFITTRLGMSQTVDLQLGLPATCDEGCALMLPTKYAPAFGVAAPGVGTQTYTLGIRGQITAGGNLTLNGTGNLVNAGDLVAGSNIAITTPGTFTNQGTYQTALTTTTGCVAGAAKCAEANPHVDNFSFSITPNTVAAGNKLTINAGAVQNNFGTLAALGDVSLTTSGAIVNQGGVIQSVGSDVILNANQIINTVATPVTLHKSYGNVSPSYAPGCNPGNTTYKESQCWAEVSVAASPAAIISGARNVTITGNSLTNRGGLIAAGQNANVNIAGPIDNTSVPLNAVWYGHWVEETGAFSSDKRHETNGIATLGSQESAIQAGSALTVKSGGVIQNTGNIYGNSVDLSGSILINGYTNPRQPTPPATGSRQVIPLNTVNAPPQADAVRSTVGGITNSAPAQAVTPPITVANGNSHFTVTPTTGNSTGTNTSGNLTTDAAYLVTSPATSVLGRIGAEDLVASLPASLKPNTGIPFYYDPYTENRQLQQAALQETGQASFLNGLSYDNQLSIDDQQKLILYSNAIAWAEANNVKLGQALTDQQLAALDQPMLWYVEQSVPDPSCALASTVCPSITVLMPQLYLPQAQGKLTGGLIAGNDINLDLAERLTNTGIVTGTTLNVTTSTLENIQRSVDIGKSAYRVEGGWQEVFGTQLAPGGFMSATSIDLHASTITAIGDALKIVNPDGSPNTAATQALLDELQAKLGSSYSQSEAHDDIHTHFIKEDKGLGALGTLVVMVAVAVITSGAGLGAAMAGATQGTLGAVIANAAVSSALASAVTGAINGDFSLGNVLKSATVAAVTAGLTNGITYDGVNGFGTLNWGSELAGKSTLAALAGTTNVGNNIIQAATTGSTATIGTQIAALAGNSLISAGVSTIINGGSFGNALKNSLVSNAAAVGAYAIGQTFVGDSVLGGEGGLLHVASHALLGCAAASLQGGNCESGAIGGAVSAALLPRVGDALNLTDADKQNYAVVAGMTALSMLAGGVVAQSLGKDAVTAASAAQNEALNNYLTTKRTAFNKPSEQEQLDKAKADCGQGIQSGCDTRDELLARSAARDQGIAKACAAGQPSTGCNDAVRAAQEQGYEVARLSNGRIIVYPRDMPQIVAGTTGRDDSFQDKISKSTAEGLLLDVGGVLGGAISSAGAKLLNWLGAGVEDATKLAVKPGGTVELFTDASGPKIPGAVGVGPTDASAIAADARNMSNIPSGSQAQVVANNPYIPKNAGGTFSMMDYLPEAARITQSGGEIIINGTQANRYVTTLPTQSQLDALGLKIQYEGPLLPQYQNMSFLRTDGSPLTDPMRSIVLIKK